MDVSVNLKSVRERISSAARRVGRDPDNVKLIAVSKGRPASMVEEAARAGQAVFGENRAQELRDKLELLESGLEWHFIGHLQRNKVNMVVGKVVLIHSLDSRRLAEAVNVRAKAVGAIQDVLLQVNVSREESKYGLNQDEVGDLIGMIMDLPALRVRGLMTIAPLMDDQEEARPYFVRLRELRDEMSREYPRAELGILSMGMTQDFEVAVEEGASMVRVGTAIFA